jgi:hypothetical protein
MMRHARADRIAHHNSNPLQSKVVKRRYVKPGGTWGVRYLWIGGYGASSTYEQGMTYIKQQTYRCFQLKRLPSCFKMLFKALSIAFIATILFVTGNVKADDLVCTDGRNQTMCAALIRPYSDNAYVWGTVCGITASPDALIADETEKYDRGYGW